jgi:hypothetical protein
MPPYSFGAMRGHAGGRDPGAWGPVALIVVGLLVGCGPASPPATASAGPIRYAEPVKDLIMPVTDLPTGTRVTTEGKLTTWELVSALATGDVDKFDALLTEHAFVGSYLRTYGIPKGGRTSAIECIVLLFPDAIGAQAVVIARGDAMLAYGYHPLSVGQSFGDTFRAVSVDGLIPDASGQQITVTSVRIMFSRANVAVQVSIQDDPKDVDPLDGLEVARRQFDYLRTAAPLSGAK